MTRAFSDQSEWNKVLPANAPIAKDSAAIIAEIKAFDSSKQYPTLALGDFSTPTYYAKTTDKVYKVTTTQYSLPPELATLRIPAGAKPAPGSDAQMNVVDEEKWVGLWKAAHNATKDTWTAGGADVYYLASNGLHHKLPESDEPRNDGHRGYPSAIASPTPKEIIDGAILHVLKVSLNKTAECHFYPGQGNESGKGGKLTCEGLILRIKPSVDLSKKKLNAAGLTIATAWQTYGVVIGDTGGSPFNCKMESEMTTGFKWSTKGVTATMFKGKISFDDFEVIEPGYHRP